MLRALSPEELYAAIDAAALAAFNDGDDDARKELRIAEENLQPFAVGYLATALLEMGVGAEA